MDMKPIIVMAGTPVDTQMGMDCLSTQGLPGVFCPISEDPNQQTAFQISSTEEKSLPSVRGAAGAWLRKSLHLLQFSFRRAGFPVRCPGNRLEDRHAAGRLPAAGA